MFPSRSQRPPWKRRNRVVRPPPVARQSLERFRRSTRPEPLDSAYPGWSLGARIGRGWMLTARHRQLVSRASGDGRALYRYSWRGCKRGANGGRAAVHPMASGKHWLQATGAIREQPGPPAFDELLALSESLPCQE